MIRTKPQISAKFGNLDLWRFSRNSKQQSTVIFPSWNVKLILCGRNSLINGLLSPAWYIKTAVIYEINVFLTKCLTNYLKINHLKTKKIQEIFLFNFLGFPNNYCLKKGSQTSTVCPSGRTRVACRRRWLWSNDENVTQTKNVLKWKPVPVSLLA